MSNIWIKLHTWKTKSNDKAVGSFIEPELFGKQTHDTVEIPKEPSLQTTF